MTPEERAKAMAALERLMPRKAVADYVFGRVPCSQTWPQCDEQQEGGS